MNLFLVLLSVKNLAAGLPTNLNSFSNKRSPHSFVDVMSSNNTCKVKVFISSSSCHYWKGKMEKGVVMGVVQRNGRGFAYPNYSLIQMGF